MVAARARAYRPPRRTRGSGGGFGSAGMIGQQAPDESPIRRWAAGALTAPNLQHGRRFHFGPALGGIDPRQQGDDKFAAAAVPRRIEHGRPMAAEPLGQNV